MPDTDLSGFERVSVVFEKRVDGGLRVSSPQVPGFRLSNINPALVTADIIPALETIIGAILGKTVRVRMSGPRISLPEQPTATTSMEYVSQIAA